MSGVLLAGEIGARDPADDALIGAFARELPRWPLVVTSADPARTARRHSRPAVDVRNPRALLRAIRRCDVLVLGDGSLRGAGRGDRLRDVLGAALAAKALGRRVAILGVGAGALHSRADRVRVGALVRMADLLVLRDRAAAEVLVEASAPGPFRVGADPAWCALDDAPHPERRRDEALVILDASVWDGDGFLADRLATALDMLARRGLRIRLTPWRVSQYGADDIDLARAVAARMGARPRILLPPDGLAAARAEAATAGAVLTLRLHGLIVAASAGTPVVTLDDGGEATSLARRLGQPAVRLSDSPGTIAAAVVGAGHGPGTHPRAVQAERSAARESFRLLRLLLDADRSIEDHDVAALPLVPEPFGTGPELAEVDAAAAEPASANVAAPPAQRGPTAPPTPVRSPAAAPRPETIGGPAR